MSPALSDVTPSRAARPATREPRDRSSRLLARQTRVRVYDALHVAAQEW